MLRLGDVDVFRVEEYLGPAFRPEELLPDWNADAIEPHHDWLVPRHYDLSLDRLVMSSHSWVVRTRRHTILIDTCIGNGKHRPDGGPLFHDASFPYLANLEAAGVRPEQVDFVLCTHLHADHVGWNTRLADGRWVPTFPAAKYVFSETDNAIADPANAAFDETADDAPFVFADSISPILEAGQAMLVQGGETLADVLSIMPSPGHTLGHFSVKLEAEEHRAVFSGDLMHHPMQVYQPSWNSSFCVDAEQARRSRMNLLESIADTGTILCPAHFSGNHCCTIARRGTGFRCEAVGGGPF